MKVLRKFAPIMFIIALITLFCTQLQNNNEQLTHVMKFNSLYEASNTPYPLQNFVYLDTFLTMTNNEGKATGQIINSASGIAVRGRRNKVYAMTAAHLCAVDESEYASVFAMINIIYPNHEIKTQKRVAFFGDFYPIEEVYPDVENDVCVITFTSPYAHKVKTIKPARSYPEIGEKVYAISSPLGMFSHEMRLIFDGYFAGCQEDSIYCFYTLAGVEGSSGSGVLNERGQLVSILDVSVINFHEITGGAKLEAIREMYDTYIR